MEISTKECTRCKRTLPNTEFRKQSKNKDGLQYVCRSCSSIKSAAHYGEHKDTRKSQVAANRAESPEEYRAYMREYMKGRRDVQKT
jgi:hypothetical protein